MLLLKSPKFVLELLILFFFTLINYGKETPLISLLLCIFYMLIYRKSYSVNFKVIVFLSFLSLVTLFYTALSLFFPDYFLIMDFDKGLLLNKYLGRVVLIVSILMIFVVFDKNRLIQAIKALLIFHVTIFYIQVLAFYIFNIQIDIVGFFTGESQRSLFLGYYRATGIFTEPSNYGLVVLSLLSALFIIGYNQTKFYAFVLFSVFLTFSTASLISALFFLFGYLVKVNVFKKPKLLIIMFMLLAPIIVASFNFQQERYSSVDNVSEAGSFMIRQSIVNMILTRSIDDPRFYFGEGMYSYDLNKLINLSKFKDVTAAIDDAGLFISFILRFGLLGVAFVLGIYFILLKNISSRIVYTSLIFTKMSIFSGIFFIPLISCLFFYKENGDD
ncbi:hypothetical protein C9J48_17700 [Photobacterium profundum]|uniref:Putative membrane protein n=1 Tax=Photobacterium profundum 3TCK TaxID=314280 RepID=Q1Z871_9GAMM|nr:hypothetical protein [Photobacterium profundum]EAS44642.1 putative membrane protein [Photobacterium profundum 3TCK]PSV60634.1 hypothetical protein C9J48_17700 [Photobacterium profundum]